MIEAVSFSETSASIYEATRQDILESSHIQE
jgi:hypothetical protein